MSDWIKKNKQSVAILAAGAVVLIGSFALFSSNKDNKKETEEKQVNPVEVNILYETGGNSTAKVETQKNAVSAVKKPLDRKQKLEQAKELVIPKFYPNSQILDFNTISMILEQSLNIADDEYINLTRQNRAQRRAVMEDEDQDKYEALVLQYNEEVENVLNQAQEQLLEACNIQKQEFEESVLTLMEKGLYQQMYMLQAAIRQKIKEKIPATKNISIKDTKQIIKHQAEILRSQKAKFGRIFKKLSGQPESANMIPLVLNTMLQDMIYKQFQIEEEDQMKNMMDPELIKDEELHKMLVEIENEMYNLMNSEFALQQDQMPIY